MAFWALYLDECDRTKVDQSPEELMSRVSRHHSACRYTVNRLMLWKDKFLTSFALGDNFLPLGILRALYHSKWTQAADCVKKMNHTRNLMIHVEFPILTVSATPCIICYPLIYSLSSCPFRRHWGRWGSLMRALGHLISLMKKTPAWWDATSAYYA